MKKDKVWGAQGLRIPCLSLAVWREGEWGKMGTKNEQAGMRQMYKVGVLRWYSSIVSTLPAWLPPTG